MTETEAASADTNNGECICARPETTLFCEYCGNASQGRLKKTCPQHPKVIRTARTRSLSLRPTVTVATFIPQLSYINDYTHSESD